MKRPSKRSQAGQAMVEFIIIFWFAFSFLMLVIQIALMFNAHSMLKLAAYNAARAAIVTRSGDGPEKPVKLGEMKDAARKAAFLTILPVIPGMHGRLNGFGDVFGLFTSLPADLSSVGLGALKGHTRGLLGVAVEYFGGGFDLTNQAQQFFDVKFVNPTNLDQEIDSISGQIEFDDTSKTSLNNPNQSNLIKVVVTWYYPLVIPFADQIIYAYTHTADVIMGLAQTSPSTIVDVALGSYHRRPVWEVGWVFRSSAFTFSNLFGFRVPLRQSYVMRMQWDRGPD